MKNDKGEVIFDEDEQKKVDAIVEERLSRDRKSRPAEPEDYKDLKGIHEVLKQIPGFETMTPAQQADALKKQAETYRQAQARKDAEARAEKNGTTPEQEMQSQRTNQRLDTVEARLQAREKKEAEERAAAEQAARDKDEADGQIAEFVEKYPDVDLLKLKDDPKFIKFVKGKKIPLIEAYEDYREMMGEAETEVFLKAKDRQNRSTGGGNSNEAGNTALSAADKKALDDWNRRYPKMAMTPKEFLQRMGNT